MRSRATAGPSGLRWPCCPLAQDLDAKADGVRWVSLRKADESRPRPLDSSAHQALGHARLDDSSELVAG